MSDDRQLEKVFDAVSRAYYEMLETYRANGRNDFDAGRVNGLRDALDLLHEHLPAEERV